MPGEYFTFSAYFHFLGPALLGLSLAYRTVDEPAEMSHVEFPRWAALLGLGRAAPNVPAGTDLLTDPSSQGPQEEQLALHVDRHFPPTLLKALHGLKRCPQELRHLLLGLLHLLPQRMKFFIIHGSPSFGGYLSQDVKRFPLTIYTTMCYLDNVFLNPRIPYGLLGQLRDLTQ